MIPHDWMAPLMFGACRVHVIGYPCVLARAWPFFGFIAIEHGFFDSPHAGAARAGVRHHPNDTLLAIPFSR